MLQELNENDLLLIDGGITLAQGGQIFGGIVVIVAGGAMAVTGQPWAGAAAVVSGIGIVAGAF